MNSLEEAVDDRTNPGLYLSGPAGIGKSILAYTISKLCRSRKKWLVIYIPDCREWNCNEGGNANAAMGYFLDRVVDALAAEDMEDKFGTVRDTLNYSGIDLESDSEDVWSLASYGCDLNHLFGRVRNALKRSADPVLIVCDEINALWGNNRPVHDLSPWNITKFQPKFTNKGALLLTGTADNDFVGCIPNGLEKYEYPIGRFSDAEIARMRNADERFKILDRIENLDVDLWRSIVYAAGNIPRELRIFVDEFTSGLTERFAELAATGDADERTEMKKLLRSEVNDNIAEWRKSNVTRHRAMLDRVLMHGSEKKGNDVFRSGLIEICQSLFLEGKPARIVRAVLRVPNFIVDGSDMYPTTVDAQKVYFDWFRLVEDAAAFHSSVAALLNQFMRATTDGARGNAFEDYLAAKLTVLGTHRQLPLSYRSLDEPDSRHHLPLQIRERVFTRAETPPVNFQHYADDTLLTHTDLHGGEKRVDVIHYRKDCVIYIEATVGNYRDTKIPILADAGRQHLILKTLRKWLGQDIFNVQVIDVPADGSALQSSAKKLSVTYRADSHKTRPDPPALYYIVATTCPHTVRPTPARIDKYNWIKVCFLEDLIDMGIFLESDREAILAKQADNAI